MMALRSRARFTAGIQGTHHHQSSISPPKNLVHFWQKSFGYISIKLYEIAVKIFSFSKNHVTLFRVSEIPLGCNKRGAFHSQKISYTCGKNPFAFKKNPSKIRINPLVLKISRTLFPMSEVPLGNKCQ